MLAQPLSQLDESAIHVDDANMGGQKPVEVAEAPYLAAFGLYLNPFSPVPDDEFYFELQKLSDGPLNSEGAKP